MNNGVSKDEIREIFLQTAIYCGVPAAIDSLPHGARGDLQGHGRFDVCCQPSASSAWA
jgi:hypothetical protein